MIDLTQGNLLEADVEALVNTVNCVGVMGKGIALQFKHAFPDNFRQYKRACRAREVRLGQMFIVATGQLNNPKYIINFPTKNHWRGKSRIEDIESGLAALVCDVERLNIRSIAIPALGCSNGGLEWSDVASRITAAFENIPTVKALLYEPFGAPEATSMPVATDKPALTRARALLLKLFELYRIPGYRLTLLEIQKLAYFLQESGEPLRLRYVKHKYGPYADNLNHVLQRLEGHYLRGYGDRSGKADIHLLSTVTDEAESVLADDREALERLKRVGCLIEGFETPAGMELLATVHWVMVHDLGAAADLSITIASVQRWSQRKRELFSPNQIGKAWQRLHDEHWLMDTKPPQLSSRRG